MKAAIMPWTESVAVNCRGFGVCLRHYHRFRGVRDVFCNYLKSEKEERRIEMRSGQKQKSRQKISRKIMTLLLTMVLAALLSGGAVGIWSLYSIKTLSGQSSRKLGETAAEDSEKALEALAAQQVNDVVKEKAAYIEEKFATVKAYVNGIASLAETIYALPDQYPDRETALPVQGSTELAAQLLWSEALENPTDEQRGEILKLGNLQDLLVQYNQNSNMVSSTYLATASGWMLQADYIAFSKYSGNSDAPDFYEAGTKQWYRLAQGAKKGETVYTDIIKDVQTGGNCIVCAQPVYSGDAIVAVAGVGSYLETVEQAVLVTDLGERGFAFLVNDKGQVMVSGQKEGELSVNEEVPANLCQSGNQTLAKAAGSMTAGKSGVEQLKLDGREVCLAYAPLESLGWSFAAVIDLETVTKPAKEGQAVILELTEETARTQEKAVYKMLVTFGVLFLTVTVLICVVGTVFSRRLVKPIKRLTEEVAKIDGGNLDYRVQIGTRDELEALGDAFNRMTGQLQEDMRNLAAVTAEKERIHTEIQVASRLQADMLPEPEGAFTDRQEFSLYAAMTPAKGVGGDFYDFFLLDGDHLALVMADVSGKGVPAALFMVVARTLIRSHVASEASLAQAVEEINNNLCANNKNGMFVTAWIGVLTISTGRLTYVNAGHCRPLIRHENGDCVYETALSGFVLAGMEDECYCQFELRLRRGDTLLLYTDGVTEATSTEKTLYGEERLKEDVKSAGDAEPKKLLEHIWEKVSGFQAGEEQFDDITMLALSFRGGTYQEKTGIPKMEHIREFADFVEKAMAEYGVSQQTAIKMLIAMDEIFSNICYYSRATEVTVGIEVTRRPGEVILTFTDDGVPYNPLDKPDPDVEELLEKRQQGGLGIYLVKRRMDRMEYEYSGERNRLTLGKRDKDFFTTVT